MDSLPFFSVVIPVYNTERFVAQTLQTVINQTFTHFEVIVINDGSTDRSLEKIQEIKDSRIRLISKPNGGVSSARNTGIAHAKGQYIAFLDSDDLWGPDHLLLAATFLNAHPQIQWFCSAQTESDQSEIHHTQGEPSFKILNALEGAIGLVSSSNVVVKSELARQTEGFPTHCKYGEDTAFWYQLSIAEPLMGYNPSPTVHILKRSNSATAVLKRNNDYIFECIRYRRGKAIHHDKALQGMFLSMLTYHLRNRSFQSALQLNQALIQSLGWFEGLKTWAHVFFILIAKRGRL